MSGKVSVKSYKCQGCGFWFVLGVLSVIEVEGKRCWLELAPNYCPYCGSVKVEEKKDSRGETVVGLLRSYRDELR